MLESFPFYYGATTTRLNGRLTHKPYIYCDIALVTTSHVISHPYSINVSQQLDYYITWSSKCLAKMKIK